ncbi:EspA/EspE family type VII secretion system effector [Mycolicibacterium sp.]|uniref:EspA/EspE family type VII secretion system effector n=1 Tax=Mycolicibacterium sp. TaxID=2320850 RepID=UPI003D148C01
MGLFDDFEGIGKVFGDLVGGGAEPAAPSWTSRVGAAVKSAAGSEILEAGQAVIAGMRLTTGWGEPEQGEDFGRGATRFADADGTVRSAYPSVDWQGGGAEAYTSTNRRQADRTAAMAVLDRKVSSVIAREAYQVGHHRDKLDAMANYLGDLSYATAALALIPGYGRAMKATVELAAVHTAVSMCSLELYHLSQEAAENATELQGLAGEYSALTHEVAPPEFWDPPVQQPSSRQKELSPEPVDPEQPGPADPSGTAPSRTPMSAGAPAGPSGAAAVAPEVPEIPEMPEPSMSGAPIAAPPAQPAAESAVPAELMSGMTSAFGAVGGVIGSLVAPLAAVLTGVAGAAAQSVSAMTSADAAGAAQDSAPDPARGGGEDGQDKATDDSERSGADGADGVGAESVPPTVVAESEGSTPAATDKLEPDHPVVPPAATRPPQ